jgi:ribokinase
MTKRKPRICVVGSSNIDLTFRTPRLPRPGETVAGSSQLGFGGKGANQAVMAARLGAQVSLIAKIGRDAFSETMLASLSNQGIDTAHVFRDDDRPTGMAAILVDDSATNCIVVAGGANERLGPADVRQAAPSIRQADVLLTQLEVPCETCLEAFRVAREAGVRTIFNPAPARPFPEDMLGLTDFCVPNETELEALTGTQSADLDQAEAAGRELLRRGARRVIVTLGSNGALILDGDIAEHIAAIPVDPHDPTGAGDAFIGSIAVFLAEGLSLREAAQRATAAAALTVTRAGAQAAFPTRSEVEQLLAKQTLC